MPETLNHHQQQIENACEQLAINVSDQQIQALITYMNLMLKWNKTYNLSAIKNPEEILSKHIIDSLSVLQFFQNDPGLRCADIGSGAGLPGIPLAIMIAEKEFTLVDSVGKKTRFVEHVVHSLKLSNVRVVHSRVENMKIEKQKKFDVMTSRAFSSIEKMLALCEKSIAENGRFYLMKGQDPQDELMTLPQGYELKGIHSLKVPGLEAKRCLVVVERLSAANKVYKIKTMK